MSDHECATCEPCIHDGVKCCGCYDGACCHSPEWMEGPQHSCTVPDPNCWRCDIAPPVVDTLHADLIGEAHR